MIKLAVSDLDGTLFNETHELDVEDSNIIMEYQKKGFQFMIATGRSLSGAQEIVERFGITCDYVCLNGAVILNRNKEIMQEIAIPHTILIEIIDLLKKEDMCFHMYGKEGTISFDAKRGRKEALAHLKRNHFSEREALEIMEKGKFADYDIEVEDEEAYLKTKPVIYKIELFSTNPLRQKEIREKLAKINDIEVTNSVADNIEITHYKAQKGFALQYYCEQNNISMDEVVVFGDSLNDKNMIELFPNSFAVDNAMENIKEKAKYITYTNTEHGVTRVLEKLMEHDGNKECLKTFKKV